MPGKGVEIDATTYRGPLRDLPVPSRSSHLVYGTDTDDVNALKRR